jgi:hypothetical protein
MPHARNFLNTTIIVWRVWGILAIHFETEARIFAYVTCKSLHLHRTMSATQQQLEFVRSIRHFDGSACIPTDRSDERFHGMC